MNLYWIIARFQYAEGKNIFEPMRVKKHEKVCLVINLTFAKHLEIIFYYCSDASDGNDRENILAIFYLFTFYILKNFWQLCRRHKNMERFKMREAGDKDMEKINMNKFLNNK